MQVGELFVKINLDTTKLQSDLAGVEAKLKALGGSLSDLAKVKGFSDITASSKQLKDALGSALPVADQLKSRLQEQQTQYGILGSRLSEVSTKYGATSKQAQALELAMQKLGNNITQTKAALEQAGNAGDKASKAIKDVGASADDSSNKVKSFGSYVRDAFATAGGMILAQGIQAVGSAMSTAVSGAIDFEAALSGVSAVAGGLTSGQLEALRQKALEVGATTSLSASQAVSAMENLVANGVDPTQQGFNGIVDATVALAEATGSDLPTAANVATDVIANFAGAGSNLQAVINGITGVTVAGKFGIDDYRLALSNGGVAAAGYGVTLSDFNTAIAATSSSFASGQTAGTAFRTFIERLTPSTQPAITGMRELGLITEDGTNLFYDSTGAIKSQSEIFGLLQSKMSGLSDAQRAAYSEMIFGAEAANFVTAAVRVGADGFNEYGAAIAKISAADQAKERLNNFAGAADALKGSIETVSLVLAGPLLSALTPIVQEVANAVGAFGMFANSILSAENPLQALLNAIDTVIPGFADLANQAIAWGSNIMTQFTAGIMASMGPLIAAMQYIGSIISSWLQPGSPPKIVPNLDQWGADAATVYYEGWSQGDYSALQDMGNVIQSTISSMIDAGASAMGKDGIIPMVMGSQGAISDAISQLNETGSVGEEAIQKIISSAGDAGPAIAGVVQSYFDLQEATLAVADAQSELNSITEEYSSKLDPLNQQIQAINDQQKAIKNQQKLEKLNETLADGKATEAEKEDARLEIQKMGIQAQIDATEKEKDVAISAAKEKLDAAKEQEDAAKSAYAAQKAQLDNYTKQNQLIAQQTQLLQQMADAAKPKGGGGGSGAGIKLPDPSSLMPTMEPVKNPLTQLVPGAQDAKASFLAMKDSITESMVTIQTKTAPVVNALRQFGSVVVSIGGYISGIWTPALNAIGSIVSTTIVPVIQNLVTKLQAAFGSQGTVLIQQMQYAFTQLQPVLTLLATVVGGLLYTAFVSFAGIIGGMIGPALQVLAGAFQVVGGVVQTVYGIIQAVFGTIVALVGGNSEQARTIMESAWTNISTGVSNIFGGLVGVIVGLAGTLLGGLAGIVDSIFGVVTGKFGELSTTISTVTSQLVADVVTFFAQLPTQLLALASSIYTNVVAWFQNLYTTLVGSSIVPDMVTAIVASIDGLLSSFVQIISDLYTQVTAKFDELKTQAIQTVTNLATEIGNLASQFAASALSIGSAIIDGIVSGVADGVGALVDAVSNAAQSALDAAKGALGIKSPSAVFAEMVGKPTMQGWAQGIDTNTPLVSGSIIDAGAMSVNAAQAAPRTEQTTINSGASYTINLDLSGSTLSKADVEAILDTRLVKITQTAVRLAR